MDESDVRGATTLHDRLTVILATTGTTQAALINKMKRLGFVMSPATLSRMLTGKRAITEQELEMICKALECEQYLPELLALRESGTSRPPAPSPSSSAEPVSAPETRRNAPSSRRNLVVTVLASLLAGGVIATGVMLLLRGSSPSEPSPAQTKGHATPAVAVALPDCTRHEVSARDLWLRDEYGAPLTEVLRGTKLTVKNTRNPRGHDKYWEAESPASSTVKRLHRGRVSAGPRADLRHGSATPTPTARAA